MAYSSKQSALSEASAQAWLYGKTSPELFPRMLDEILRQSSPRFATAGYVNSRGEYWMHNISEYPSDAVVSSLSQILEANAPRKYFLSAMAAQGILRRATKRGKLLPPSLQAALEHVVQQR